MFDKAFAPLPMDHDSEQSDVRADLDALRRAIIMFAREHRRRPFGVLREVGVQAALKRLADQCLGSNSSVDAAVVDQGGWADRDERSGDFRIVNTDRIRLEAKIQRASGSESSNYDALADSFEQLSEPTAAGLEEGPSHDRTDLLLYKRHGVQLFRCANGPGDVVYRSLLASVLAAVEIKADPSHTAAQKHGYGRDIARLLALREFGVVGLFVVLDKSSPFYGKFDRQRPLNCINWEPTKNGATALSEILRGGSKTKLDHGAWDDIMVSRKRPRYPTYIEIFNVSAVKPQRLRYFAYRR
ncbi:hypothetical protein ACFJIX_29355 [Roseateles sp. UC29_93]|uniref:hypothetical protein n=1 Tax=Roseateles sp. UC29_93 TaxID=3350177 RepID=UPI00366D5C99